MAKILNTATLGRNIQKARLACGFTQEETVQKLGVLGSPLSRSTYSIIEIGRCNIYVSDLVALQKIFKVDYAQFFEGIPTSRSK